MKAGDLKHRITIRQPVKIRDGLGGEVVTWPARYTLWGAVEPLAGREFLEGLRLEAEVTTRIRIRAIDGITPDMRAEHNNNLYRIRAVIEVKTAGREIQLMCTEIDDP